MASKYHLKFTFTRDVLGTNPLDPHVLDTHIHKKQRELIMGISKPNKEISRYLDAISPTKEKTDAELEGIIANLEKLLGYELPEEHRQLIIEGKLKDLKETLKDLDMKGTTVFFFDPETQLPMIGDHMVYGFLKEAAASICSRARAGGDRSKEKILVSRNFTHSCINTQVRCAQEFISFDRDIKRLENGDPRYLHRSLRSEDRTTGKKLVALIKSEQVPAGAQIEFDLLVQNGSPLNEDSVRKLFDEGEFIGFGQWRNAKHGCFEYEMEKLK